MAKRRRPGGSLDKRPDRRVWDRIRTAVLERDGYRCRDCGIMTGELEVHHVRAVSAGGDHSPANLRCLCRSCHIGTHHPVSAEVAAWRELLREVARPKWGTRSPVALIPHPKAETVQRNRFQSTHPRGENSPPKLKRCCPRKATKFPLCVVVYTRLHHDDPSKAANPGDRSNASG